MQPLQIGVCNWSLKMPDLAQCLATVRDKLGLRLVQLGYWDDSFKDTARIVKIVQDSGVEVHATTLGHHDEDYSSIRRIAETGGYMPDALWEQRFAKTQAFADFTAALGVKYMLTHIGFVPHQSTDPKYGVMVDRLQRVCDALAQRRLTLIMETGQEKAESLLDFIQAVGRDNIAINFDPANMILYGVAEPAQAVGALGTRIASCHAKDANWSKDPGTAWGEEVVLGTGQADIPRIVSKLRALGFTGPLIIEREAGDQRLADIAEAINLLKSLLG